MTAARRPRLWDAFPLIWLIWLVYPIQDFTAHARLWPEQLLFWGSLAAFCWVYARTFTADRPDDRWAYAGWVAALLMWGLGLQLYGSSAFSFLIYGASLIGWQRHLRVAILGSGLNLLLMVGMVFGPHGQTGDLIFALFILVAAYGNHASYVSLAARRKLAQVQLEKEKLAADAERERIAREALQEVRSAVRGYRGSGFSAELARAKVALDAAGVKLNIMDHLPDLPGATEASAAMLLREAETGASTAAIAAALHLSEGTVRNYLSEAISKLGAENRVEAARAAREKGWL